MTNVAKYNTCKGVSTGLTFGAPLITAACMGDFFAQQPSTAISGAAVFAILFSLLFMRDKIADMWKAPSALKVAIPTFIICVLAKNIVDPLIWVSGITILACCVDELSFKQLYKGLELEFPKQAQKSKHVGFYFVKQATIDGLRGGGADEA